ncbi:hypothetical protein [Agrococcus sp. SGAir0287]|uniref:hypothetical protein n=1 Tax=Agrococcus sp. SGAir0287 TaxID=2070347 RepID=UPI0010CCE6AD|nr:hypothetical protein [Agrococcus sp. SGAir0287]QCR20343.1 hypothetical protein C1N71_13570 [Agrococcus sp. SGAir0287]
MSEHLTLGPAPRPATGVDLVARMRAASLADAGERLRPAIEGIFDGMRADVDGADVTIDVDATGVTIDGLLGEESAASELLPTRAGAVRVVEHGDLRSLTVRAHPVHVEGVPVDLGLTLEGARLAWVEVPADGTVGLDTVAPDDAHPMRGHLRVEAPLAETVEAVRRAAETSLAELGVTIADLDVRLRSEGPREVAAEVDARVRKGFLGAPASASATLRIDDALRLHVEDLRITSSNVIVAGLLATVRGKVEARTKEPIDLAGQLPAGVRVTDVRLEAGDRIGLEARIG